MWDDFFTTNPFLPQWLLHSLYDISWEGCKFTYLYVQAVFAHQTVESFNKWITMQNAEMTSTCSNNVSRYQLGTTFKQKQLWPNCHIMTRLKCNSHFLWAKGQQCPTKCQRWSCFRRQLERNIKMIWKQSGNMFTLHQHPMWCKLCLTEHSYPQKMFSLRILWDQFGATQNTFVIFCVNVVSQSTLGQTNAKKYEVWKNNRHSSNLQRILN